MALYDRHRPTPSIVIEDVDGRKQTRFSSGDFSSPPPQSPASALMTKPSSSLPNCYVTDFRRKTFTEEPAIVHPGVCAKPSSNSFSLSAINMCTVDAYVSPLSLCQVSNSVIAYFLYFTHHISQQILWFILFLS